MAALKWIAWAKETHYLLGLTCSRTGQRLLRDLLRGDGRLTVT